MRLVFPLLLVLLGGALSATGHADEAVPGGSIPSRETTCLSSRDEAGREPCATQARDDQRLWICSLQSVFFRDCLASLAAVSVRLDPALPPAGAVYQLTLQRADGHSDQWQVLAPANGRIHDRLGGLDVELTTHAQATGGILLAYRLGTIEGSQRLDSGESAKVSVGDAQLTIQRL